MRKYKVFAVLMVCILMAISLSSVYANSHDSTDSNNFQPRIQYMCTHCGEQAELESIEKVVIDGTTYYKRTLKCTDPDCGKTSIVLYPY